MCSWPSPRSVQGWLRGVAITGVADGVLIGGALAVLGVPAALPLGVITFFAAFFPIVGATVATAVVVGLVVLAVQQIEGDVLLPVVMERQVHLHPVVVLVVLGAGRRWVGSSAGWCCPTRMRSSRSFGTGRSGR